MGRVFWVTQTFAVVDYGSPVSTLIFEARLLRQIQQENWDHATRLNWGSLVVESFQKLSASQQNHTV